jgi:hypothetical protein
VCRTSISSQFFQYFSTYADRLHSKLHGERLDGFFWFGSTRFMWKNLQTIKLLTLRTMMELQTISLCLYREDSVLNLFAESLERHRSNKTKNLAKRQILTVVRVTDHWREIEYLKLSFRVENRISFVGARSSLKMKTNWFWHSSTKIKVQKKKREREWKRKWKRIEQFKAETRQEIAGKN